jgi:hypothetical protein
MNARNLTNLKIKVGKGVERMTIEGIREEDSHTSPSTTCSSSKQYVHSTIWSVTEHLKANTYSRYRNKILILNNRKPFSHMEKSLSTQSSALGISSMPYAFATIQIKEKRKRGNMCRQSGEPSFHYIIMGWRW